MNALLLRPTEVAELLGVSRSKVFSMLASEELPAVRFGRVVRIPRNELDEWIRRRTRVQAHGQGLLGRILEAGFSSEL